MRKIDKEQAEFMLRKIPQWMKEKLIKQWYADNIIKKYNIFYKNNT